VVTSIVSTPHPIDARFVDGAVLPARGRLGLTHAPGRRHPESHAPEWNRDLETDLLHLRAHHGGDLLVSLMEPAEMEAMGIAELPARARAMGWEWRGFPIRDMDVPSDRAAFRELLSELRAALDAGRCVILHCLGGLGRSGTVAAALLVELGTTPDRAIEAVRRARPGAIQTVEQEKLVRGLPQV
jgi:ADP-ribosyl-[dinitrogen reductase] hydrolase